MFCRNCGSENVDGAKFCANCGSEMAVAETPVVEPAAEPVAEPVVEPVVEPTPVVEQPVYSGQVESTSAEESAPAKPLAIIGMICGICSIVICCSGYLFGPAAIILSSIAKSKGNKSGMATAGLITGIIGTVIGIIYLILAFVIGFEMGMDPYYYY